MNSREREVSKIYHSSWIFPILNFVNDEKLNYDTIKVWKRVWILGARSENGCGKWNILVWNWVRIWGTGRHTPTKNSEEYHPPGDQQSFEYCYSKDTSLCLSQFRRLRITKVCTSRAQNRSLRFLCFELTSWHAYARVSFVPKIFWESNKSIFSTYIFDGSNISSFKWQIYTTRFPTYFYLTINHIWTIFNPYI